MFYDESYRKLNEREGGVDLDFDRCSGADLAGRYD